MLAFDADLDIGCIVITGSEKAFAAGADIAAMANYSYMDTYKNNYITRNWETILRIRKPVIAAVCGYALGGGCELAMMCDFIIAADKCALWSARNQTRHHARRRRHPAFAACRLQITGYGSVPNRAQHECRRSLASRFGGARGAAR